MVGFGANSTALVVGGIIDVTSNDSVAFSMPRDGVITSLSAYYSVGAAATLIGSTVTITAQLYQSTTPNDSFSPVSGSLVNLTPSFSNTITIGENASGTITGLSVSVDAGTRLMLVLSADITDGIDVATILSGYVSGGLGIS